MPARRTNTNYECGLRSRLNHPGMGLPKRVQTSLARAHRAGGTEATVRAQNQCQD